MLKYKQLNAYQKADQGDNHPVDRMARIGINLIKQDIKFLENIVKNLPKKIS